MIRRAFSSYAKAYHALAIARRIIPDRHWYLTNEDGPWAVVESV